MTDGFINPRREISYEYDHVTEQVIRRVGGERTEHAPAACHATVTDIHDAIEDCERYHHRVERVILGAEEYEDVIMHAVAERGWTTLHRPGGPPDGLGLPDMHDVVENTVGQPVTVIPGSAIHAIGRPVEELFRSVGDDA